MKFEGCNFFMCGQFHFSCPDCPCYDADAPSECLDPIHPILNIPLSKL